MKTTLYRSVCLLALAFLWTAQTTMAAGTPSLRIGGGDVPEDQSYTFPNTAVGQTYTQSCVRTCFSKTANNCDNSGTITLDKNVSAPFGVHNYRVGSASSCTTGTTPTSLPVTLASGEALYFDLSFSPTSAGTFTDSLVLSGLSIDLSGSTPSAGNSCVANATTLCINQNPNDGRFQIRVSYDTSQSGGLSGSGNAIPLSSVGVTEGGLFWFFGAGNPEMLIKILDGCSVDSHFWVFYAATTNVGFTVTVTDTTTGHQAVYTNTDLTAAPPVQDTAALTCP